LHLSIRLFAGNISGMDPSWEFSRIINLGVIISFPVAWVMMVCLKRRFGKGYDGVKEASSEEILSELKREFSPCGRTVVRTQTEYLPFLFECIRENIDGGFEDPQVISLLERVQLHKPDQERGAMFSVVSAGKRSDLHLRWRRDAWDRIELRIQGAPHIIRALREYRRKIPKAVPGFC
jgi:hypothetical protein